MTFHGIPERQLQQMLETVDELDASSRAAAGHLKPERGRPHPPCAICGKPVNPRGDTGWTQDRKPYHRKCKEQAGG